MSQGAKETWRERKKEASTSPHASAGSATTSEHSMPRDVSELVRVWCVCCTRVPERLRVRVRVGAHLISLYGDVLHEACSLLWANIHRAGNIVT